MCRCRLLNQKWNQRVTALKLEYHSLSSHSVILLVRWLTKHKCEFKWKHWARQNVFQVLRALNWLFTKSELLSFPSRNNTRHEAEKWTNCGDLNQHKKREISCRRWTLAISWGETELCVILNGPSPAKFFEVDLVAFFVTVVLTLDSLLVTQTVWTRVEDILAEKQAVSSRVPIGLCWLFVLVRSRQVPLDFFSFLPLLLRYPHLLTRIGGAGSSLEQFERPFRGERLQARLTFKWSDDQES